VITTVAGAESPFYNGDGGPATSATLTVPSGVAVDGSGNLYIADTGNFRIRKVSADTGVITTVAGNGNAGYSGDGGPATSASLSFPFGVAVDGSGNLYIADSYNNRIRKVEHPISTITFLTSNANRTTTQNLVLTATVSPSDVTGSVQFFDGNTSFGSAALSAGAATRIMPQVRQGRSCRSSPHGP
jgi:streptogramin lyase